MKDSDYRYIPEDERRAVAEKLLEPTRGVSEAAQVGRALGRAVLDGRGARRLGEMLVSSADDLRESYEHDGGRRLQVRLLRRHLALRASG